MRQSSVKEENLPMLRIEQNGRNWKIVSEFPMMPKELRGDFTSYHTASQVLSDFQAGVRAKAMASSQKHIKEALRVRRYRADKAQKAEVHAENN